MVWLHPWPPYEFIGLGAMDVTKPYEFIWLGDAKMTSHGTIGGALVEHTISLPGRPRCVNAPTLSYRRQQTQIARET